MKNIRFTHKIVVPISKEYIDHAGGYSDELNNVTVFELSQEEFDNLSKENSLFDAFYNAFSTIIDDCEEERIESNDISKAIAIVDDLIKKNNNNPTYGMQTVLQSLKCAKERDVFWEIINGAELYE